MRSISPVIVSLLLGIVPGLANAGPRPPSNKQLASSHAERAVAAYDLQDFQEALKEFESAYKLYPTDTILFNVAQSRRRLGLCQEAATAYRQLLQIYPRSRHVAAVNRLLPQVEESCKVKDRAPSGVAAPDGTIGAATTDGGDAPADRDATTADRAPEGSARVAAAGGDSTAPTRIDGHGGARARPDVDATATATITATRSRPRVFAALSAGMMTSSAGAVTPVGATVGASWRPRALPLDIGARVAGGGYAWAGSGYRGSSTAFAVLATGGDGFHRGAAELRIDVGVGATILSGLDHGHPLIADGRRVSGGMATLPMLEAAASGQRMLGGGWRAVGGLQLGVVYGGDAFGGALGAFTAFVGIGRSL